MFLQVSVILLTRGCLVPGGACSGGGCLLWGCLVPVGVWTRGVPGGDPPGRLLLWAYGTHPTGMHSCFDKGILKKHWNMWICMCSVWQLYITLTRWRSYCSLNCRFLDVILPRSNSSPPLNVYSTKCINKNSFPLTDNGKTISQS